MQPLNTEVTGFNNLIDRFKAKIDRKNLQDNYLDNFAITFKNKMLILTIRQETSINLNNTKIVIKELSKKLPT